MSYFQYVKEKISEDKGKTLLWIWGLGIFPLMFLFIALWGSYGFALWVFGWVMLGLYYAVAVAIYVVFQDKRDNYRRWKLQQKSKNPEDTNTE